MMYTRILFLFLRTFTRISTVMYMYSNTTPNVSLVRTLLLLARALQALSDPYCQSTCLSVSVTCVCVFVRKFDANISESAYSTSIGDVTDNVM